MAEEKDFWDKADVAVKVFVPIIVGLMVLIWNNQRTAQQTAAAMTQIAVGILAEDPEEKLPDPLRSWAIQVLQSPGNPPALSEEAANQLEKDSLPINVYGPWSDVSKTLESTSREMEKFQKFLELDDQKKSNE